MSNLLSEIRSNSSSDADAALISYTCIACKTIVSCDGSACVNCGEPIRLCYKVYASTDIAVLIYD